MTEWSKLSEKQRKGILSEVTFHEASLAYMFGNRELAIELFKKALEYDPDNSNASNALKQVLEK